MRDKLAEMFSAEQGAKQWDTMYAGPVDSFNKYIFRSRRDFAVNLIKDQIASHLPVLDLGCGAGPFTSEMSKLHSHLVATDFSADILKKARARIAAANPNAASIPLVQSNSQQLPFEERSFSAIVCLGMISYVPDRVAAIREMYRVLDNNGLLILTFRNFYNPIIYDTTNLLRFAAGLTPKNFRHEKKGEFEPGAFLKPGDIRKIIENSGFNIVDTKGIGRGPVRLGKKPLLPLAASIALDKVLEKTLSALGFKRYFHGSDVVIFICKKRQ